VCGAAAVVRRRCVVVVVRYSRCRQATEVARVESFVRPLSSPPRRPLPPSPPGVRRARARAPPAERRRPEEETPPAVGERGEGGHTRCGPPLVSPSSLTSIRDACARATRFLQDESSPAKFPSKSSDPSPFPVKKLFSLFSPFLCQWTDGTGEFSFLPHFSSPPLALGRARAVLILPARRPYRPTKKGAIANGLMFSVKPRNEFAAVAIWAACQGFDAIRIVICRMRRRTRVHDEVEKSFHPPRTPVYRGVWCVRFQAIPGLL